MPNKIANRVKMTVSGTPGTGTITLGSAVSGFQSFTGAGVSNGDTVPYVIEDGSSWELGVGTYTSSGTTMSRSVTASSNSGNAINATSAAIVMISPLAADLQAGTAAGNLVALDGSAKLPAVDGSALTNLNMGAAASGTLSVGRGGTGLTSLTAGYIPYGNGTGALASSTNLFWDSTNNSLGIGTGAPNLYGAKLAVASGGSAQASIFIFNPGIGSAQIGIAAGSNNLKLYNSYSDGTLTNGKGIDITSGGSVFINGTSAPILGTEVLGVYGPLGVKTSLTTASSIWTNVAGATSFQTYYTGTGGTYVGSIGTDGTNLNISGAALNLQISGVTKSTLDASGNLGLGVSPSAWSAYKALQVASGGGALSSSSSSDLEITTNAYYSSGWLSQGAGVASTRYRLVAGAHTWWNAPSASAGSAITFTQAMTLDASGNLLVGTTTSTSTARARITATPTSQWGIDFSECSVTVANGSNATLPTGSGIIIITDGTATGATGMYILGGGNTSLISQSYGSTFVTPTTTPASGKYCIQSDGTNYRIYNNYGSSITFLVAMIRSRNSN
jgi:hypothetical protein